MHRLINSLEKDKKILNRNIRLVKKKQNFRDCEYRVQVVSRQKLNCNRENIEVYRVKYDFFSIRIEFLTTNDLDPGE